MKLLNYSLKTPNNLAPVGLNQTTFKSESLKSTGLQIRDGLPNELKSAESLKSFEVVAKE